MGGPPPGWDTYVSPKVVKEPETDNETPTEE
jgi:hypothetical protein